MAIGRLHNSQGVKTKSAMPLYLRGTVVFLEDFDHLKCYHKLFNSSAFSFKGLVRLVFSLDQNLRKYRFILLFNNSSFCWMIKLAP